MQRGRKNKSRKSTPASRATFTAHCSELFVSKPPVIARKAFFCKKKLKFRCCVPFVAGHGRDVSACRRRSFLPPYSIAMFCSVTSPLASTPWEIGDLSRRVPRRDSRLQGIPEGLPLCATAANIMYLDTEFRATLDISFLSTIIPRNCGCAEDGRKAARCLFFISLLESCFLGCGSVVLLNCRRGVSARKTNVVCMPCLCV